MLSTVTHPPLDPRIDMLIGIDDTDNLDTRGTGYRARTLAQGLADAELADILGITRHQLLVDPRIPYTSHNSSACLQVSARAPLADIHTYCRQFLLEVAAVGADIGLCIASVAAAARVIDYGLRAKVEVLNRDIARATAAEADILLEGLTGTHGGIIGSLAGVGLYVQGDDGRYIWLPRIRELATSTLTVSALRDASGLQDVLEFDGEREGAAAPAEAVIDLGGWARPVRVAGRSALFVEKQVNGSVDYVVADKQRIKAFRP
ncbi:MAG: hypothetical protein IT492_03165 [Gammaproteobacteria bacterium]|nr:hypothetical protein [Gammaproteobacteria bacterium]